MRLLLCFVLGFFVFSEGGRAANLIEQQNDRKNANIALKDSTGVRYSLKFPINNTVLEFKNHLKEKFKVPVYKIFSGTRVLEESKTLVSQLSLAENMNLFILKEGERHTTLGDKMLIQSVDGKGFYLKSDGSFVSARPGS